ncbi:hypothetical protein OsJ_31940 [Oryza sativa Japonica Group]|uniref:Uncharacterized protein n=1 Tax=Oryza sativa subsp. japonica TaxID=39947 RepID=B9G6B8_ORYSJ|nr:hypothetical protein OsJ_31940 [Oryza sativa Japonica Group]
MASLLRRHRHPHPLPAAHLLRRFSALPDVDHPPPPASTPTTPASTRSPILDLQLAVRGEADPARIHSLVATALSRPDDYPRLHGSRPLFSLAASRLARLRRPDLAASLLRALLDSAPGSPGLLARAISLFPGPRRSPFGGFFEFGARRPNSELAAARKLLGEMAKKLKHRPAPDIVSYNTVLAGYSAQGDEEGFEKLLKEISAKKLEPNVVTYNCRIQWFAKKGETFKGEELLDAMESKDVAPNYLTYNALVQGYCKEGNVGSAMRVFKRMKVMKRREGRSDLGVSAHSQTYVVLFRSLVEKERLDDALWICKSCFAMKAAPPFEAVKGLVEGLVKGGKSAEAKDVVAKMNLLVKGDAKVAWEKIAGELSLEGTPSSNP